MARTIEELVVEAMVRIGVITNGSSDINILYSKMRECAEELLNRHNWAKLIGKETLVSDASGKLTSQSISPINHGAVKRYLNDTFLRLDTKQKYNGTSDVSAWQGITKRVGSNDCVWIETAEGLFVYPYATGAQFERYYITGDWAIDTSGAPQGAAGYITSASTIRFPEEVMILGIVWRFKQLKGLVFDKEFRDYELAISAEQRKNAPIISLGGSRASLRFDMVRFK